MNDAWLKKLQGWLWPRICLLCGDPAGEGDFCAGCLRALPWQGSACLACGTALPVPAPRCGACQQNPFSFDEVNACFRYDAPVDGLAKRLKYGRELALARALGGIWAKRMAPPGLPDVLIPVPLHSSRLRERGFNQSLEIARPLARRLLIPLAPEALVRIRATAPQAGLDAAQRARNVRDAFQARLALDGKHVTLIDDVMTTGHTADAAAQALRAAGAKTVTVWVLTRA